MTEHPPVRAPTLLLDTSGCWHSLYLVKEASWAHPVTSTIICSVGDDAEMRCQCLVIVSGTRPDNKGSPSLADWKHWRPSDKGIGRRFIPEREFRHRTLR